ncbi:RimK/LysX family protein, partial [Vibrio splendidus]
EAPVVRYVKIRQSTNDQTERRAVIELWVKVGKIHEKAQFTLADRSQMSHPVLLGREFIKDIALVDVSKKYVQTEVK